jgi:glucokinase
MYVIGVDLGGTKVAVACLRGQELSETVLRPTDRASAERLIDQIVQLVESVRGEGLDAVGIGVPSVVDFKTGRVVSSVNVPMANLPLRALLGERLGVPVFLDNDASVAALAEAHDQGLHMVTQDLVMITVGTGVGGGLVLGGRIYRGATGGAGELGHTIVAHALFPELSPDLSREAPAATVFPQPGSLERVASGRALDRLAEQCAERHPESTLGRLHRQGKPVYGPDALEAARGGDAAAAELLEVWGQRLGIGVANAINTFDPAEVVIGGGAARAGDLLLEPARRVAFRYVLPGLGTRTTIRLARHGVRAGVLGAALLAVHELHASASAAHTNLSG